MENCYSSFPNDIIQVEALLWNHKYDISIFEVFLFTIMTMSSCSNISFLFKMDKLLSNTKKNILNGKVTTS